MTKVDSLLASVVLRTVAQAFPVAHSEVFAVPGQKLDSVDFQLTRDPSITAISDDPIRATYPDGRITYHLARFSPDGKILAVVTNATQTSPGGPFEVWIYDLTSRQCIPVILNAPLPGGPSGSNPTYVVPSVSASEYSVAWSPDDTLYVLDSYGRENVEATEAGAKEIKQFPTKLISAFDRLRDMQKPSNSKFFVTTNGNHGLFQLVVGRVDNPSKTQEIADGSWELTSFLFDSARSVVFYPTAAPEASIIAFDLGTQNSRQTKLPFGDQIQLQDRLPNGTIAYTVAGPCVPDLQNDRFQRFQRPRPPVQDAPQLCLVSVPLP